MVDYIWVTTRKEFLHNYPDAPTEVAFLRNQHRHIFHFKIYLQVFHDNRDVEFIMFKRDIEYILGAVDEQLEHKSCEMLADYIYENIKDRYANRKIIIEVSEDGENGVQISYPKPQSLNSG